MEQKNKELIEQSEKEAINIKAQIYNNIAQINKYELEKSELIDKINELNSKLKEKEDIIKKNEKELLNIKNENIQKEKEINAKIENIENNYSKK